MGYAHENTLMNAWSDVLISLDRLCWFNEISFLFIAR